MQIRLPGEPKILAFSMQLYYKGHGPAQFVGLPKFCLCEECLVRAITGSPRSARAEALTLLNAVRERLAAGYSAVLEADQAPASPAKRKTA
jgi:hypothetical protein